MANRTSSQPKAASSRMPLLIGVIGAATAIVATLLVTTFGGASGEPLTTLSVHDLRDALQEGDPVVLDVREPWEYEQGHVEGARLMPLIQNTAAAAERANLDKDAPVYVICRTGSRSMQASRDLVEAGFTDVRNVAGGITEWAAAGYDVVN
ncbi:MAG: rhodanese-like domain-containing protein [Trueperaceae bacterium]|nr:rhodanese-like domain-containing protein [Trueperaceae bacterium]